MSEPKVFTTERRVEFCETDAAGIAHFSSFGCYMEQAEHAFWRHLGTSVVQPLSEGVHRSWPRVHVECDFKGAASFEDVLQVSVRLLKLGRKSLTFEFAFVRDHETVATGRMTTVCCEFQHGNLLHSVDIPQSLRIQLDEYLVTEPLT